MAEFTLCFVTFDFGRAPPTFRWQLTAPRTRAIGVCLKESRFKMAAGGSVRPVVDPGAHQSDSAWGPRWQSRGELGGTADVVQA